MSKSGITALLAALLWGCGIGQSPPNKSSQVAQGPIAQAIHEDLAARIAIPLSKPHSAMDRALEALYAVRGYQALWNDPATLAALMGPGFGALAEDGLRAETYVLEDWVDRGRQVYADGVSARERASFDLQISRRYLRALSNVAYGKVNPASVGTQWETAPTAVDQRVAMAWVALAAQTGGVRSAFALARPPAPLYEQLRSALALQTADPQKASQLRVNLERTRWLFQDLPASYVLVDIASYRVRYQRPSGEVWESKVVVGRPYRETPAFRSEIDKLTVNPTWTVPPTIFEKDIAPKAQQNAAATLAKKHLRAIDGQGNEVPLDSIDWSDSRSVILRQDPGPENPLGQIKISFDNPYQVYLHDTPSRALFEEDARANSSGCIRVENVLELARLLLEDSATTADLQRLVSDSKTKEIKLNRVIPVLLHYSTVDVTPAGEVVFEKDIYNRDPALLAALDQT
ncbi:MAG: L,D-transpeptidase family protein [Pseudomonadota bacterium]|nr:L,D-transpeptidase family protein [Pseudomonadota bacterium]